MEVFKNPYVARMDSQRECCTCAYERCTSTSTCTCTCTCTCTVFLLASIQDHHSGKMFIRDQAK